MDKLKNHLSEGLSITPKQRDLMQADVINRVPEEACGIVAGKSGHALKVFPATNVLHSRVRYRIEPKEQLDIFNEIDEQGWDLLAVYHSHPNGPPYPSSMDLQEAYYPDAIYIIWSQIGERWIYKGFLIQGGKFTEVPIKITQSN